MKVILLCDLPAIKYNKLSENFFIPYGLLALPSEILKLYMILFIIGKMQYESMIITKLSKEYIQQALNENFDIEEGLCFLEKKGFLLKKQHKYLKINLYGLIDHQKKKSIYRSLLSNLCNIPLIYDKKVKSIYKLDPILPEIICNNLAPF